MRDGEVGRVVVIKFGGSVFANDESYRHAARFVERRLRERSPERFVVVVSAQKGVTDGLERLARGITADPNPRTVDLLWSTGEMRSVALLALHLQELDVAVVGLNVHQIGLHLNGDGASNPKLHLSAGLRRACDTHRVVVVPGFFGALDCGTLVSLGRGGSDLTAVMLAERLEAVQCELVKDVPGYFTQDPNVHHRAEHLPRLSYDEALGMAECGCQLVQLEALQLARRARLRLVVRGLHDMGPVSVVSDRADA